MSQIPHVRIAIVYHSAYGHTAKQAEAVASGAIAAGAETLLISVDDPEPYWEAEAQPLAA